MRTLAFERGSAAGAPYVVLIHTASSPTRAEWSGYVATLDATLTAAKGEVHIFIATDGGGPDAPQRKELADVVRRSQHGAMSHIFTNDAFVRGIVTAFNWVSGGRAVAHRPDEFRLVCEELGYAPMEVLRDMATAQGGFPRVATLGLIERDCPQPEPLKRVNNG